MECSKSKKTFQKMRKAQNLEEDTVSTRCIVCMTNTGSERNQDHY